jgi:hypothetical protein
VDGGVAPRLAATQREIRSLAKGVEVTLDDMRLTFQHDPRGESLTVIQRSDGAVFTLYSRKHRVPHDLAHAVTERELRLADGVFGCIAAGVVFDSMGTHRDTGATHNLGLRTLLRGQAG